jgi:acyl carrier protein
MTPEQIDTLVREVVRDVVVDKAKALSLDIKQHELSDYQLDSITFVMLVVRLEEEFEIEFADEYLNLSRFASFDDFVQMIYSQKLGQVQ